MVSHERSGGWKPSDEEANPDHRRPRVPRPVPERAFCFGRSPRARYWDSAGSPRLEDEFTHSIQWGETRLRAPLAEGLHTALQSPHYHYVSLDLMRQPELAGLLGEFQPDWIFHLASGLRDAPPDHLFRTNVEGTIYLIEAVREAGIDSPRLIFGSTGYLYGRVAPEALPIHESTPCTPIDLYGVSKLASENASHILARRYGHSGHLGADLQPGRAGPGGTPLLRSAREPGRGIAAGLLPPLIEVEPLTATRDFLDVRDAAHALHVLAKEGSPDARTTWRAVSKRRSRTCFIRSCARPV